MPSVTFTLTTADAARINAVAAASGFPSDGKAWVIQLVKQAVEAYEQSQNQTTYVSSYTPVAPT
jgi:hypothetical protein